MRLVPIFPSEIMAWLLYDEAIHMYGAINLNVYIGYKTNGEFGFDLGSGPPGSINHKRSYANTLAPMSESQFRLKGKMLAAIAKEFYDNGIEPNVDPIVIEPEIPWGLVNEALAGDV